MRAVLGAGGVSVELRAAPPGTEPEVWSTGTGDCGLLGKGVSCPMEKMVQYVFPGVARSDARSIGELLRRLSAAAASTVGDIDPCAVLGVKRSLTVNDGKRTPTKIVGKVLHVLEMVE